MPQYENGQRVRVVYRNRDGCPYDEFTGIIRGYCDGDYAVEVEESRRWRHDCGGLIERGRGWWVNPKAIEEVLGYEDFESKSIPEDALFEVLGGE